MNQPSDLKPSKRNSITWKLLAIVFLVLIFLIPSALVNNLIQERANRQQATIAEVSASWGKPQTIAGPVIVIPYNYVVDKEGSVVTRNAYFLPSVLDVKGDVKVEMRSRGIYDVPVYETKLALKGTFPSLAVNGIGVTESQMRPAEAVVVFGIPDMRGIEEQVILEWNGAPHSFAPGVKGNVVGTGAHAAIPMTLGSGEANFSIELTLRGSQALAFVPAGKKTTASLSSNWPHPSFAGAFLPQSHTVTDTGFTAAWQVLDLNRTFPDKWTDEEGYAFSLTSAEEIAYQHGEYAGGGFFEPRAYPYPPNGKGVPVASISDAFGVRLLDPVDLYQKTERSAKYGIAVIALVFVVILFTELTARRRIHPVQYALIGFALLVFYTLLLSLAEHIRFGWSYLVASAAVIGMVTLFCRSIMESWHRALMGGGVLTLFYGFVYVLLQLTDYALLLGSIALFAIIAGIMWVSRRIDWYGIGQGE